MDGWEGGVELIVVDGRNPKVDWGCGDCGR